MYLKDQSITSGIQRNYINAYWFSVGSKYYFSSTVNMVKAYLSINLGFSAIENWEIFGNNEYKEVLGHFTASPGLGVEIPATKNIGFLMYFKYQHSFKAQNSIHYSWLNTGIGMYFILASDD